MGERIPVYRGKDAKIIVNGTTLGYAESATVDITKNAEQIWEIGSNEAVEIAEGNVEITGSIDRAFVDLNLAQLLGTKSSSTLSEFDVVFQCSTLSGAPIVSIAGCKIDSITEDISQDGTIMFNIDFIGRTYEIKTS